MRVGVNTRVLLSSRMEGVCRYIHETLRRMVLAHPETEFIFFFDRGYDPQFIYADNVTPIVVNPPTRHPLLWYIWFELRIPQLLKKHKIDVFYSGDTFLSLTTKVPTVLVSHDIAYYHYPEHIPFLNRKYYQHYFPKFHKAASRIVAVSQFTKDDIVSAYQLDEKKVVVGHNAIKEGIKLLDEDERQAVRDKYTNGSKYLIYVGAVHPRKNIDNVVRAFDQFKRTTNSDLKLVLVARIAWNADSFKKALAESKYREDIIHLKELYNKEVNQLTASAEAMIYVSLFEGFGLPILEAMACDVPVITSNVSSMPEVAGDAAICVDPKDVNVISKAIIQITSDEDVRKSLLEKSKVQREKFSWDRTAEITYTQLEAAVRN